MTKDKVGKKTGKLNRDGISEYFKTQQSVKKKKTFHRGKLTW